MRENHGGCIVQQRLAQHLARVNLRAVDRAAKQLLEGDQAMAVVEVKAAEHFIGTITQLRLQEAERRLRCRQRLSGTQFLVQVTAGEFDGRLDGCIARRSDAFARPAYAFGREQGA